METVEDIVIVGAGIAGLATALGLHRMGLRGLVLESSDGLRTSGFALTMWPNAWKALDALGVGDSLRQHLRMQGTLLFSSVTGLPTSQVSYDDEGKQGAREIRCVKRKALLEALEKELPRGTIRFSSKIVSLEEAEYFKLVHLADETFIKTKVLIGCDGVNSVVASWLGLAKPVLSGRLGIRGIVEYHNHNDGHDFTPNFLQFFGKGFRSGFLPCDCNSIYWFFTFTSSLEYKDIEDDPVKMKQFVLDNIGKVPARVVDAVEKTDLQNIISSPLRLRWPWNVLWRESYKENVCVAGDALHPMTPDIGQGGCSALEDAVILARCLAEAMSTQDTNEQKEDEEYNRIKKALEKFGKQRKWRSFMLISTAYVVGIIQQSSGKIMSFLRDKVLTTYLAGLLLKRADFDCGKLNMASKIKIQ